MFRYIYDNYHRTIKKYYFTNISPARSSNVTKTIPLGDYPLVFRLPWKHIWCSYPVVWTLKWPWHSEKKNKWSTFSFMCVVSIIQLNWKYHRSTREKYTQFAEGVVVEFCDGSPRVELRIQLHASAVKIIVWYRKWTKLKGKYQT